MTNLPRSHSGNHHAPVLTVKKTEQQFDQFMQRLQQELMNHHVITHNPYTPWFGVGQINQEQLRVFIVQFSIFSNQFLIAQLLKMLAAENLDEMRATKEILANELGVAFNGSSRVLSADEQQLGDINGSIEGGRFHFRAAHFELLLRCAEYLGLGFCDLGRRQLGSQETLFFCDELQRLYGNDHYQISAAASFAVEHWAAAGFWQQLVDGLNILTEQAEYQGMPTTFFSWHNKLEANHARHTEQELREYYFSSAIDEDEFIATGSTMLDAVYTFWDGLNEQRLKLVH